MPYKKRHPIIATLFLSLTTIVACTAPGAGEPTSQPTAGQPSPTVAVETPESTVTPSPTETAAAPLPTETTDAATPTATSPGQENPLIDSNWTLVSFGPSAEQTAVLPETTVTLQFDAAGQAGGSGGCNSYGGEYEVQDSSLSFSPIVSTMMACADEALMDQEQRYLAALQEANAFELSEDGQRLTIQYGDDQGILTFERTEATPPDGEGDSGDTQAVQIGRLAMFDNASGWAIGRSGETGADQILITTDGGARWQSVTPEEVDAMVMESAPDRSAAAYFASPQQAWVAFSRPQPAAGEEAPRVWLTGDGGQSWQPSAPLDFDELAFEYFGPSDLNSGDGQFGWLLAHLGAGMSHDYIAIFTTSDGGQNWQRVADPDNNPGIQVCSKSGLVFTDTQTGWLAGNCPGLMQPLFLYQTTDGGASWSQATLPAPEGLASDTLGDRCGIPQVTVLPDLSAAFALRCFDFEEETSQAWLYTTADGGASWQAQPLPEPAGVFSFLDSNEGWYVAADESQPDANSRVYHTIDGGATWSTLAQVENQAQVQLSFASALNGWLALGYPPQRMLLRTTDGGTTWEELEPVVLP